MQLKLHDRNKVLFLGKKCTIQYNTSTLFETAIEYKYDMENISKQFISKLKSTKEYIQNKQFIANWEDKQTNTKGQLEFTFAI